MARTPILLFGSIVTAHRPLETKTALGGRAQEAVLVGITSKFAVRITLFNPVTKRTFIRHSFRYLSDTEPVCISYVVTYSTPEEEEVLTDSVPSEDNISSSVSNTTGYPTDEDYTYVPLPLRRAHSNLRFRESNTNNTYKIHNIVKLSNQDSVTTPCFQLYDITLLRNPPDIPAQYEYEPISQFSKIKIIYFIIIIVIMIIIKIIIILQHDFLVVFDVLICL